MNTNWARRFFWACAFIALLLFLWPVLDPSGLQEWVRLSQSEQKLQHQIKETRQQILELQDLNQRLQRDLTLIERMARENLIYARPNEFVILLRESPGQRSSETRTEEEHAIPETIENDTESPEQTPSNPSRPAPHQ